MRARTDWNSAALSGAGAGGGTPETIMVQVSRVQDPVWTSRGTLEVGNEGGERGVGRWNQRDAGC